MTNTAIKVENIGKVYRMYDKPHDRLKDGILWRWGKRYGREFWALQDVSFEIRKGETLGIMGRNGSGKSTLLQIIAGTLQPSGGSVQVNGRVAALLELGSGFNPEYSGRENIYMNAAIQGLTKEETDKKFDAIAAFADIGKFIDQPVKIYSSGMLVRLAFAVATSVDPDILIVDEALAVGDVRFQVKCHRRFEEFREMNKTILLVSHSGSDVVRLCNQAIWLDEGRIRRAGPSKHIAEEYFAWMIHDTGIQKAATTSINATRAGNPDVKLIPIPPNACITGDGGAIVNAVGLFTEENRLLAVLQGPTKVILKFQATINTTLEAPYFAFQVINAKGLRVLGSNTYVLNMKVPRIEANRSVMVEFSFPFPELENGQYLIALGIADGTPQKHIRQTFIADAYELSVISTSTFQTQSVLVKIPDCVADIQIN